MWPNLRRYVSIYGRWRDARKAPNADGSRRHRRGAITRGIRVFVLQLRRNRSLHYDLRIESEGVLKSWTIPRGPSLNPGQKRLAVRVEDHPLDYARFEGVIRDGHDGMEAVIVWDAGPYHNLSTDQNGDSVSIEKAIDLGHVSIWLEGQKLRGGFSLIRQRLRCGTEGWLIAKMKDDGADLQRKPTDGEPLSVLTGRSINELTNGIAGLK